MPDVRAGVRILEVDDVENVVGIEDHYILGEC